MVVLVILRSEKRIRVENYEAMEPFFGSDEPPQTDDVLPYIAVPYSAVPVCYSYGTGTRYICMIRHLWPDHSMYCLLQSAYVANNLTTDRALRDL
jgi:hypothetical protein